MLIRFFDNPKFRTKEGSVASDYRATLKTCSQIVTSFNGADKLVNTPSTNGMSYILFALYAMLLWWVVPYELAQSSQHTVVDISIAFLYAYTIGTVKQNR